MKKSIFRLLPLAAAFLFATFALPSCSDDNTDPNNGQVVKPGADVPDPEGTIPLTMRNESNGNTYLDRIYIDRGDNFTGDYSYFTTIGQVKGLGNVSSIPRTGWTGKISVIPGNGYVAAVGKWNYGAQTYDWTFYRIYVTDYVTTVTGGVIGAEIKYQKPFKGTDESLTTEESSLTFDQSGGSKAVVFTNKNFVSFTCSSSAGWCKVEKASSSDLPFLQDGVLVTVDPQETLVGEQEATVTLTTAFGKKTELKVLRSGSPLHLAEREVTFSQGEEVRYVALSSTYSLANLQVQSSAAWCEAELVDQRAEMARKMARVKYVNGRPMKANAAEAPKSLYVKLHVKANGGKSRDAKVTVKSKDGKASDELIVYQEGGYFSLNETSVSLSAGEASRQVYFSTNIPSEQIKATSSAAWCKAELENNHVNISCSANPTEEERSAVVTFTTDGTEQPLGKITVTQKANTFSVPQSTVWFDRNSGNTTVTIKTELSEMPETTVSADWCTVSFNGNKMTIRVSATTVDRKATISFKGKSAKVTVKQSKYAVGDTYSEDKVEGKVIYMQNDDRFIAKELGNAAWSTENVETGATCETDGPPNMNVICTIPGYKELYPAFALCNALNVDGETGWFLPAYNQLRTCYPGSSSGIWSSTEVSADYARTGGNSYYVKSQKKLVVAFCRF